MKIKFQHFEDLTKKLLSCIWIMSAGFFTFSCNDPENLDDLKGVIKEVTNTTNVTEVTSGIQFDPQIFDLVTTPNQISNTSETVTITASEKTTIISVTPQLDEPMFTLDDSCSGKEISKGRSCSIVVKYEPTVGTSHREILNIVYSDNSSISDKSTQYLLSGTLDLEIGNSVLSPSSATMTFDTDALAPVYDEQTLTLSNTSEVALFIGELNFSSADFSSPSGDCPSGSAYLSAGESCTLTIRFSPLATGERSGSLIVKYGTDLDQNTNLVVDVEFAGLSNPSAPTDLEITNVTATTATISWADQSAHEDGYIVEICQGTSCASSFVVSSSTTLTANSETHTFSGLTENEFYRFRVTSQLGIKLSDQVLSSMGFTFGGTTASSPASGTDFAPGSSISVDCNTFTGTYIKLNWTPSANISSLRLYEKVGSNLNLVKVIDDPSTGLYLWDDLDAGLTKNLILKAVTTSSFESQNLAEDTVTTSTFAPCLILGQSQMAYHDRSDTLHQPMDMTYDAASGKFAIADAGNNRVLIWNSLPTKDANGILSKPDLAFGQPDFNTINTSLDKSVTFFSPKSVKFYNGKMLIADSSHHRVLIYNSIPTVNQKTPDVVIGQTNTTAVLRNYSNTPTPSALGFDAPYDIEIDPSGKLLIIDYGNNRVMGYNSIPTSHGASADFVIGQANFTSKGTALTQSGFNQPSSIHHSGTRLYIASLTNRRILGFNSNYSTGMNAEVIIGQDNYTSNVNICDTANGKIKNPNAITSHAGNLLIGSNDCDKIYIFDESNLGLAPNEIVSSYQSIVGPRDLAVIGNDLFYLDQNIYKLSVFENYTTLGAASQQTAYLGTSGLHTRIGSINVPPQGPNNVSLNNPTGMTTDGTRLVVADRHHHRVLIWNQIPTRNNTPPDVILGQPDIYTFKEHNGGATDTSGNQLSDPDGDGTLDQSTWVRDLQAFSYPNHVLIYGDKLVVNDIGNDRVLIWETWPTTNHQPADLYLGTSGVCTAKNYELKDPTGMVMDGDRLLIANAAHDNVVIYNTFPSRNNQAYDVILGQPDSLTCDTGAATTDAATFDIPYDVKIDAAGRLYVSELGNDRVLVYNSVPTVSGASADFVLGQQDFTSKGSWSGSGAVDPSNFNDPIAMGYYDGYMYVVNSNRFCGFDTTNLSDYMAATRNIVQSGFSRNDTLKDSGIKSVWGAKNIIFSDNRVFFSSQHIGSITIVPAKDYINGYPAP